MKIYMSDIRNAKKGKEKICARGTRAFFLSKGWDFSDFLENGIDLEIVERANDAMAQQVVEYIKNGRKQ